MTLNGRHFALFYTKRQLLAPTVSNSLKLDPYYQRQKCSPVIIVLFWQYMVYEGRRALSLRVLSLLTKVSIMINNI